MARTMIITGDPNAGTTTQPFNTTIYRPISGNSTWDTTENNAKIPMQTAGTFSNMTVSVITNTINAITTYRFRKNAANGNQTFTVGSSTSGHFQDTTHTDTVVAADLVNYSCVVAGTSGSSAINTFVSTFDTTTPTTLSTTRLAVIDSGLVSGYTGASTTYRKGLTGWFEDSATTTTEVNDQTKIQYDGTFKNFAARVATNSRTTTTTFRFRKNAANGTLTVAFGSTATGIVQDTTHSDAVVAGDLVNYNWTNGTGTLSILHNFIAVEFQTTTDPGVGLLVAHFSNFGPIARATTFYQALGGAYGNNALTEAQTQTKAQEPWSFKGLGIKASANTITSGSTTVTLRINGADTTLIASITASTTGWFQDTTHTETVAVNDLVNYKVVTGTGSGTQTVTIQQISMYTEMPGSSTIAMTPNLTTNTNKIITKI